MDVISHIAQNVITHMNIILTVKGMANMNINTIQSFARSLVITYSTFDDEQSQLNIFDLPDFVQHEFASLIMSNDTSYASEATGPDNGLWESKMLPALSNYLKDSTNIENSITFNNVWRDCTTAYLYDYMQEIIDIELYDYNSDRGTNYSAEKVYGVPAHGYI
jgi:hypothetical protein